MNLFKKLYASFKEKDCSPVLSDHTIMEYNRKGILIEQPITKEQLQPNSVDLTLADSWKILKPNDKIYHGSAINPAKPIEYIEGKFRTDNIENVNIPKNSKWYILEPHQFVLMASNEVLNIPNGILSFVQGRSSIARLAIQTEQAGLIDAGFRGTITFEVFNQSKYPIILYTGMRIAQVYFFKAEKADQIYGAINKGSKYYRQIEATGSKIHLDKELHR